MNRQLYITGELLDTMETKNQFKIGDSITFNAIQYEKNGFRPIIKRTIGDLDLYTIPFLQSHLNDEDKKTYVKANFHNAQTVFKLLFKAINEDKLAGEGEVFQGTIGYEKPDWEDKKNMALRLTRIANAEKSSAKESYYRDNMKQFTVNSTEPLHYNLWRFLSTLYSCTCAALAFNKENSVVGYCLATTLTGQPDFTDVSGNPADGNNFIYIQQVAAKPKRNIAPLVIGACLEYYHKERSYAYLQTVNNGRADYQNFIQKVYLYRGFELVPVADEKSAPEEYQQLYKTVTPISKEFVEPNPKDWKVKYDILVIKTNQFKELLNPGVAKIPVNIPTPLALVAASVDDDILKGLRDLSQLPGVTETAITQYTADNVAHVWADPVKAKAFDTVRKLILADINKKLTIKPVADSSSSSALHQKITKLENEVKDLHSKIAALEKEKQRLKIQHDTDIISLKQELNAKETENKNLQNEVISLTQKLDKRKQELDDFKSTTEKKITELNNQLTVMRNEVKTKELEIKQLQNELSNANRQLSTLNNDIQRKELEILKKETDLQTLRSELADAQRDLTLNSASKATSIMNTTTQTKNELLDLKKALDDLKREKQEAENKLQQVQASVITTTSEHNKKISELNKANTEISKLQRENQQFQSRITKLQIDLQEANAKVKSSTPPTAISVSSDPSKFALFLLLVAFELQK